MASRPTRQRVRESTYRSWSCETGKICHATQAEAFRAVEFAMDAGMVQPGCHLVPYHCDRCNRWHVSNKKIYFPSD